MPRIGQMRAASALNINIVTSDDYRTFDDPSVDFSIRFGMGDFGNNQADLLFRERCRIIASPSFLANNPAFDPDNPATSIGAQMMLDHGDPYGIGWMDWRRWHELTSLPFPGQGAMRRVQSYPAMLDIVCAGEGISIGTLEIEDDLVASGKLIYAGQEIARDGYGYFLVYRKELLRNPSFRRLRDHLLGSA